MQVRAVQDYLEKFDGQAVTIEDFVATLEQSSGQDLQQFRLWYSQAGTPRLTVTEHYDADAQVYELVIKQHVPDTPGQKNKQPMHIPLVLGLLDDSGQPLSLDIETAAEVTPQTPTQALVHLRETETTLRFPNRPSRPVVSLLRGFSAPVKLDLPHDKSDLHFLVRHDVDPFSRWDAGQTLLLRAALEAEQALRAGNEPAFDEALGETFSALLETAGSDDQALLAEMLALPGETYIAEQLDVVDPDAVVGAYQALRQYLAGAMGERLKAAYEALRPDVAYRIDAASIGRRRLQRQVMDYLAAYDPNALAGYCWQQYDKADNMTDTIGALAAINDLPGDTREQLFADFEQRWRENHLVMDKWLRLQSTARRDDILERLEQLMQHPIFSLRNPNRVRAVIGAFTVDNMPGLHRIDGSGYRFVADYTLKIDQLNGQLSARLVSCLTRWRRYEPQRRQLMRAELERIQQAGNLSSNLYEIVSKSLAEE